MFEPEELKYVDLSNGKEYFLKISRATARQGILRSYLREQQRTRFLDEKGDLSTPTLEILTQVLLLVMTYPDLIASVVEQKGFDPWPVVADDFEQLPEEFVGLWEDISYRLNPHWVPTKGSFPSPVKQQETSIDESSSLEVTQPS